MTVLEIQNLKKRRTQSGGSFELRVPIMSLEKGRFYGVVGASGSGKSTLLDLLALVMRPDPQGTFRFISNRVPEVGDIHGLWARSDENALAYVRRAALGYVLQSGGLIGFLTVRQNLQLPFQVLGRKPDNKRIRTMAERFGIDRELNKKPRHLSGGQRQRVAILRALMLQPPLILADEPTASVDQFRSHQIVAEFRDLAKESGCTIVMVSHDDELVRSVSDMILKLTPSQDDDGTAVSVANWE